MIYRKTRDNRIELIPEAIELIPQLNHLGESELRYVIMAYDYVDGPYRRKPTQERINLALQTLWHGAKKQSDIEDEEVINAITFYKSLIYDANKYIRDGMIEKKHRLRQQILDYDPLSDGNSSAGLKTLMDSMKYITTNLEDLDQEIRNEDDRMQLKGDRTESRIEIMKRNRKLWDLRSKGYAGAKNE